MSGIELAGRIVFAALFVFYGIDHFARFSFYAGYARAKRTPLPGLAVAGTGAMLVVGGTLVGVGAWLDLGALILVTFLDEQRRQVLEGEDMSEQVKLWVDEVIERTVTLFTQEEYAEDWDLESLTKAMEALYGAETTVAELEEDGVDLTAREVLVEEFVADAQEAYTAKEEELGTELMRELERFVILQVVDQRWRDHLENMDYLREGVHLRAMAQKDPLVEYTAEGEVMFEELGAAIREEVVFHLYHAELAPEEAGELEQTQAVDGAGNGRMQYQHETVAGAGAIAAAGAGEAVMAGVPSSGGVQTVVASERDKIGRNDPCWCGSGKKFKKCHGA